MPLISPRKTSKMISVLFTAICTAAGSVATWWFTSKAPHLAYASVETLPLESEGESLGIYHVTIVNDGNKEAEKVVCVISVPNANLEKHRVSAPESLSKKEEPEGQKLRLTFDTLNPKDRIQVSLLARSKTKMPSEPDVSLRGTGITGEKKSDLLVPKSNVPEAFTFVFLAISSVCLIAEFQRLYDDYKYKKYVRDVRDFGDTGRDVRDPDLNRPSRRSGESQ